MDGEGESPQPKPEGEEQPQPRVDELPADQPPAEMEGAE